MLSIHNKYRNISLVSAPLVIALIIFITIFRIYALSTSPIELSVDEAQYWHWSRDLQLGYYTKPPIIAWAIAVSTIVFGNEEWAVRIWSPIMHFMIAIFLWISAETAFGKNCGRIAALTWIFIPAASFGSFIISTDTPLLLFWTLSLLFLLKSFKSTTINSLILIGINIGLAFLSKYAALYFIIFFKVWWILFDRGKIFSFKNLILIYFLILIVISGNIYWNYKNDFSTINHTVSNADLQNIILNYKNVLNFLTSQLLVFGPITFLIFIFLSLANFLKNEKVSLLVMLSLPIIILITIQSFLKIANANWGVTAYVSATILVSSYVVLQKHNFIRTFFKIGLVINFFISLFILKVTITGDFSPIDLKSNPLRKSLGFEILSDEIRGTMQRKSLSKVVFLSRGDISRFNYYLNRFDKEFENKIFLKTQSKNPGNFYEANYNYDNQDFLVGERILIVSNKKIIEQYQNILKINFIKKIYTNTTKNVNRTYYLLEGVIK